MSMSLFWPENKFENSLFRTNRNSWFPPLDFHEEEKEYIVNAELPGATKEQVNIDVREDDTLVISGETKKDEKYNEGNTHIQERRYGSFTRAISLPRNVKTNDITAKFQNGILEVKLPKDENKTSSGRKIEIK
ncbi:HSP20-like chaperone [Gigaspora margarita]|uniref:HSP20-like chaperone n=1 Tax=Gigaspora margarita TaxID=4874 RepID=A0A8H4AV39_GIGMA|nr:HSP20-like chaperone [Gigaspora margarita]